MLQKKSGDVLYSMIQAWHAIALSVLGLLPPAYPRKLSQVHSLISLHTNIQPNDFLILPPILTSISSLGIIFLLRYYLQICDMHFPIEFAPGLVTAWDRAMVPSVASRIAAGIRLSTWEASCQISQSIQLLAIQSPIMARGAAIIRAFTTEVIIVAELLVSKP